MESRANASEIGSDRIIQWLWTQPNSSDQQVGLNLLRAAVHETTAIFWEGQWEAIDAVVNRRARMLIVQRTGWGKSSVYFIATRLLRNRGLGPTLIVSPLLALMRNQIDSALRHGVQAVRIDSTNQAECQASRRSFLLARRMRFLCRRNGLRTKRSLKACSFPSRYARMLVIDEAHCHFRLGARFPSQLPTPTQHRAAHSPRYAAACYHGDGKRPCGTRCLRATGQR